MSRKDKWEVSGRPFIYCFIFKLNKSTVCSLAYYGNLCTPLSVVTLLLDVLPFWSGMTETTYVPSQQIYWMSSCWFDTIFSNLLFVCPRVSFVFLMSERSSSPGWLLQSPFHEQLQLIYNVGHVGVVWVFSHQCVRCFALISSDFIFPLPHPSWVPLKIPTVLSELESNIHIHICIHIWRDGEGGFFLRLLKNLQSPVLLSCNCMAPCWWACSLENWPFILPPCFSLLSYFQSCDPSQIS